MSAPEAPPTEEVAEGPPPPVTTLEEAIEVVFDAARYGDSDAEAKDALTNFPTAVDAQDEWGQTPLHMACANGHTRTVVVLLHFKANPALANLEGNTPLHWAAVNGKVEAVHLLIKSRADVSVKNKMGHTPLMECAEKGFHEVETLLLQHDAEIDRLLGDTGHVRMAAGTLEAEGGAEEDDNDDDVDMEPETGAEGADGPRAPPVPVVGAALPSTADHPEGAKEVMAVD